mmetsp:Transcript_16811/g.45516  ORF Transcript_16811/g.45516 Transcript_16811/m.45516 type:complete len:302 (-) Transcript_16811:58-963(-)
MASVDVASEAEGAEEEATWCASWWEPAARQYGLFNLLMCRAAVPEKHPKPLEIEHLKFVDSRFCSPVPAQESAPEEEAEGEPISEGEPSELTERAAWPGKAGSWWRVHASLGEDVIVRKGVSLSSPELRSVAPADVVQQAGPPRAFSGGRARGCIRLPVRPCGWVTADARKAGGPRYLVRAGVPRWRVVYSSGVGGGVIVRAEPELESEEVSVLNCGDIVEQSGPRLVRPDGIIRMPVRAVVSRQVDKGDGSDSDSPGCGNGYAAKTLGWVTVDASAAGGPTFFKQLPEVDNTKRRRRRAG